MIDPVALALASAGGVLLGVAYFGGLYLTLRHMPAERPGRWLLWSWIARLALALIGLRLAATGGPAALAACLVGFFLARALLVRRLGPAGGVS